MRNYINIIEELSLNAWPAYQTELYDGWLLRYSKNYTHRTNCVNIVGQSTISITEKIEYCQQQYFSRNTPAIFKISPIMNPPLDKLLDQQGYDIQHITDTFVLRKEDFSPLINPELEVHLEDSISREWIHALFCLNGTNNLEHRLIVPTMYQAIPKQTICAYISIDNTIVATGLGIIDRDHVGIYAIYIHPDYRSRQLGKTICSSILQSAFNKGIHHAYLQVVTDNNIAKHVYHSIGFKDLYTYWFRCKNQ